MTTSMVKPKRTKTTQSTAEYTSGQDDLESSIQATAPDKESKQASDPNALDNSEESVPEKVVDPVTVTSSTTFDATAPNK